MQTALKTVIEPIFEADMLECSFGFRPRRSTLDALQVLVDEAWRGKRWVVETDIASCYEEIPHDRLMAAIEERICDRKLLKLLRAMLRAGVMQDGAVKRSVAGTPQGGVVSPVLCNVYLHRLDRQWATRGSGELVRYADDLLAICRTRGEAQMALEALRVILGELGLRLKEPKTRIVELRQGGENVTFLRLPAPPRSDPLPPRPAGRVPHPVPVAGGDAPSARARPSADREVEARIPGEDLVGRQLVMHLLNVEHRDLRR